MKSSRSDQRVRETAWPWDQPPAVDRVRPLWQRVFIQMLVMTAIAGLFFVFGKRGMTYFILGLAALFLLLALAAPLAYGRKEAFFRRFAIWVGSALTHTLLLPFYWLCFIPARLILAVRRIDPMTRQFPAPGISCWHRHPASKETDNYKRQY